MDILPFSESLSMEDRLRERDLFGFHSIKKTTQTGIEAEDDESYDLSVEDEPYSAPMAALQKEIRTTFEQLYVTQDIHGAQLAEIVESTCKERLPRMCLYIFLLVCPHIEDNVVLNIQE
ncbi:hypothetical protein M9H77_30646 [Catharanthus roseus]|uniref:Uncharacterized protein n=1 Tax=Catharanthus roseus TaxID=4058 RepID=A0ACB9ZZW3_CATRO|nr:hypothetical protein M9H77_30646 [Catharanthus roseus]